ncbi:MAG: NAD-dependent protein deacetylase [Polyangiaceae bacterium]
MTLPKLVEHLAGRRLAVLTGAGCSTESGIPDYRGPETARRARNPMPFKAFIGDPAARRRYWARSMIGFPRLAAATPNPAHQALAELEHAGVTAGVITQNVDGLHQAAGSRRVVELHGNLGWVRCLDCDALEARRRLQERLVALNGDFAGVGAMAPDGDADVAADTERFVVPSCQRCGGDLKPAVVFFGESVPQERVTEARRLVDHAEALLVVGSSLVVFSGYRFVRQAAADEKPVFIINQGPTRGDPLAELRLDARAGTALPDLVAELVKRRPLGKDQPTPHA